MRAILYFLGRKACTTLQASNHRAVSKTTQLVVVFSPCLMSRCVCLPASLFVCLSLCLSVSLSCVLAPSHDAHWTGHQGWMGDAKRDDDDWMSTEMNLGFSEQLATALNCSSKSDVSCLRSAPLVTLYDFAKAYRFAPAMPTEGDYPLGLIAKGQWNKVPTIIGGQSCESCSSAVGAFGYPNANKPVTKEVWVCGASSLHFCLPVHHPFSLNTSPSSA